MAQQIINVGPQPNDGLGDPLRTAFIKTNNNFTELYARFQTTPPIDLRGKPGDVPGMYADDIDYFYYCFAIFDGTNQIWNRCANEQLLSPSQIVNGNTRVDIQTPNGDVDIFVGAGGHVASFTPTGLDVVGTVSANTVTANYFNVANLTAVNLSVVGNTNTTGPITSANTITGNILQANAGVLSNGIVSAAGDISTNGYFVGNGSQLTGLIPDRIILNNSSTIVLPGGNIATMIDGVANSVVLSPEGQQLVGNLSASGDISGAGNVTGLSTIAVNGIALTGNLITQDYTFPPGMNGISVANLTIANTATVILGADQDWKVI